MVSTADAGRLARKLRRLYGRDAARGVSPPDPPDAVPAPSLASYRDTPVEFARDVLGVTLTADQERIARALPGRVKIEAGHSLGKTHLMAVLVLWWFHTRDPGVVVCNAPKFEHLCDVLWAEIRMLTQRAVRPLPDHFIGPRAPEMYHHPGHWAKGFTTSKGEAYQGRHHPNMLFVFDEDEGIDQIFWTATATMYQPDHGHAWIASCNPLTTSSASYLESQKHDQSGGPKWKLFTLSSLRHPNVIEELAGRPAPIPNAVSLGQVSQWFADWTTPVERPEDRQEEDIEWPPPMPCPECASKEKKDDADVRRYDSEGGIGASGKDVPHRERAAVPGEPTGDHDNCPRCAGTGTVGGGVFYRPGPVFLSRVMGHRPTAGVDTVWSTRVWERAITPSWTPQQCWERGFGISIGVDAAGYGDDDTAFHVRSGPKSLYHEARNGWGPGQAAGRLKELCCEWAEWYNRQAQGDRPSLTPFDVQVTIEFDGGFGVGVYSHAEEYYGWRGISVGGASGLSDPNGRPMFANLRAEMWFDGARKANGWQMDLSALPQGVKDRLRLQLLSPKYTIRPDGSRLVESKKEIKARLGRSPDDADALLLSHLRAPEAAPTVLWGAEK